MEKIHQKIASLIFVAEQAISLQEIVDCLAKYEEKEVTEEEVLDAIEALKAQYSGPDYGFELFEMSGGYQFMTKPEYHRLLSIYINTKQKRKLSRAAMETLAIIAYSQPISKSMMEQIRGVNCDYSVQKLLERELIEIKGRSDGPGRPLLYGVGDVFLDYFGIKSTQDLPKLKDIAPPVNEIGDPSDFEELVSSASVLSSADHGPEGEVTVALDGQEVTVDLQEAKSEGETPLLAENLETELTDQKEKENKEAIVASKEAEAIATEERLQEEEEQENERVEAVDEEAEHAAQEEHEAQLAADQEAEAETEEAQEEEADPIDEDQGQEDEQDEEEPGEEDDLADWDEDDQA